MQPQPPYIHIPEPCEVKLKDMRQQKGGYYCHGCQKHEVDLRKMSDRELSASSLNLLSFFKAC